MAGATVGFFGKLPSHGDFIERRVSSTFRDVWDGWLQHCVADSRQALGSGWLDCYLTSPMWRFFLCEGVAGATSYAGVLLPSVDRVGRYFPLTVVIELPAAMAPLAFARAASRWFGEVERLCAEALQSEADAVAQLDAALSASADMLSSIDQLPPPRPFPGTSMHWHWPVRSVDDLDPSLGAALGVAAQAALRPMTMWWTEGSERVRPSVLLARSLPRPETFKALLDGSWQESGWDGEVAEGFADDAPPVQPHYCVTSGALTDSGTVRQQNQDNFLCNDDNRLWAVADGLGGHSRSEVASQMVIDALNGLEPTATLNMAVQSVATALARVNADLFRAALGAGAPQHASSTVVALAIRGQEWGVSWAGDSRAYLYRAGILTQLTQDHKPEDAAPADDADPLDVLAGKSGEITRAVGGEESLQLDTVADLLVDGDRFLLCSDGLYMALTSEAIVECLLQHSLAQDASRALIDAARKVGARDNVTAVIVDLRAERDEPQA